MSFAARRLAQAIPLLLIISLLVFGLIHAAPGGPLSLYLDNPNVRPADVERLRRAMGLDRPLAEQYLAWLGAFARGDWGYSFADGRPVRDAQEVRDGEVGGRDVHDGAGNDGHVARLSPVRPPGQGSVRVISGGSGESP